MAWKWFEINEYRASVGGHDYYGGVQLFGEGFYALLKFYKEGPLSHDTVSTSGEHFTGHMDYQQMQVMIDLLRNEKPVHFGWNEANPNHFHLMTGKEPVGDGDGLLSADAGA